MRKFKWIWIWAVTFILVVLLTNCFSVYLAANNHPILLNILLLITHSGDALSIGFVVLFFVVIISNRVKRYKNWLVTILVLWLFLLTTLGGVALLNEHLFKTTFNIERPSIKLLKEQGGFNSEKMYRLPSKAQKREYLTDFFNENKDVSFVYNGKEIKSSISKLWRYEVGYSFPSGHSTNAFLLAVLMCYVLCYLEYAKGAFVYGIIFMWSCIVALSRVMLGVHSPLDISFGAVWGSLIGIVIVKLGVVKSVFFNRKVEKI